MTLEFGDLPDHSLAKRNALRQIIKNRILCLEKIARLRSVGYLKNKLLIRIVSQ